VGLFPVDRKNGAAQAWRSPFISLFSGQGFREKFVLKKGFLRTGECRAKTAKQTCGNRRKRKGGAKGFDNNATRMATKFFLLYAKNFVRLSDGAGRVRNSVQIETTLRKISQTRRAAGEIFKNSGADPRGAVIKKSPDQCGRTEKFSS
jgi:hypothetical protein